MHSRALSHRNLCELASFQEAVQTPVHSPQVAGFVSEVSSSGSWLLVPVNIGHNDITALLQHTIQPSCALLSWAEQTVSSSSEVMTHDKKL